MGKSKRDIKRRIESFETDSGDDEPHPNELHIVRNRVNENGEIVERNKEVINYD